MCRLVTEYLNETVKHFPDKVAFIDKDRKITFSELKHEAFCIAQEFVKINCFKKPVLIFMEKSVSMISSFMGVAYSGNFYSPLDTKMPEERINKILDTLKPEFIITDRTHFDKVKSIVNEKSVLIFEDIIEKNAINENEILNVSRKIIDTDILYVLFTSGSTGTPKGVIINHRAVVDYTDWVSTCYGFDETTVFANQAQLYFDLSIQDVYAPMRNGSTTVLIANRMYTVPVRVWKTILENNVNTLVWIPSMLSLFANLDILEHVEHAPLKTVLFCGEVMPMKQLNYWIRKYPEVTFGNLYGPTECTDACTYYTVNRKFNDDDVLPMGKPCENSDAFIVDENGNIITKQGEIGELLVRGNYMANGKNQFFATIPEWLYLIDNAEYVISNSFHCAIFSLLFGKQFGIIKLIGIHEGMNTRLDSLFDLFGIPARYINSNDLSMLDTPYNPVRKQIENHFLEILFK